MLLWLIILVLTLVVVSILVGSMLGTTNTGPKVTDVDLYQEQIAALDRDIARQQIAPDEAERLRNEISRRLLDAARRGGENISGPTKVSKAAVIVVALVSAGGALSYSQLGVPTYPDMALQDRLDAAAAAYKNRPDQETAESSALPFDPMAVDPAYLTLVEQLRAAVTNRKNDLQGLTLLAQNEASIGNHKAAADAQRDLIAAKGPDVSAEDIALLGQYMVESAGGLVTLEAEQVFQDALGQDPTNSRATFFVGMMFWQNGRADKTLPLWQSILMTENQGTPIYQAVLDQIERVAAIAGQSVTIPDSKGPTPEAIDAAADLSEEDRAAMISGMVDGLESRLFAQGGSLDEWLQLLNATAVLGNLDRGKIALENARIAFASDQGALSQINATASALGLVP